LAACSRLLLSVDASRLLSLVVDVDERLSCSSGSRELDRCEGLLLLLVFVFLLVLLVFFLSFCLSERAVVSDEVVDTVDDEEDDDGVAAAAVDVEDNVDEHISTPAPVRVEEECGTDSASSDDVVVVVAAAAAAAAAAAVPGDAENDLDERLTSVSGCREVSAMLDCDEEES